MNVGAAVKVGILDASAATSGAFIVTRVEDEAAAYYYNVKEVRQYYVRPFDLESKRVVSGSRESKVKFDEMDVLFDGAMDEATELEKSRKLNQVCFIMFFYFVAFVFLVFFVFVCFFVSIVLFCK